MPSARECANLLLETIPNLMRGLHGVMRQRKGADDEPHTLGQYRMLALLEHEPRTLSALAAIHHVAPSTMSRSVDLLVRRAWVERQHDPNDRRLVIVRLTDEGRSAHAAMIEQNHDTITDLIAQLDEEERAQLYDGLSVLQTLIARTMRPDNC
jgi:DNA-binding MarR family transcriptional regulator